MTTDENKAIVRRFIEQVLNGGDVAAADQYMTAQPLEHDPWPGQPPTLEGWKQGLTALRTALPDYRFTIEDLIAEGDKIVVRGTSRGTHKGEFMGIAPTGKQFVMTELHIVRIADGKIVEHWGNHDDLGMLQQLGVVPPMDIEMEATAS